ncbi:MAG: hypothetical protein ACFFDH_18375 [Promethearchaeota archaeon]
MYRIISVSKIKDKNQVTLTKEILELLKVKEGDSILFVHHQEKGYLCIKPNLIENEEY